MSMSTTSTLTKLRNYNNILFNEYFGQVNIFPDNWLNMIGSISNVVHADIKVPMQVELLNIVPLYAYELENFEHSFYINEENIPTIAELCGFDNENFKRFQFSTGYSGKRLIGLYIFKKLNF